VVSIILALSGCGKKNAFGFDEKIYIEEREDGWIYVSEYMYAGDSNYYNYDAYNFKYKYIEGYDLLIYDAKINKVVGSSKPVLPYLSLLPEAEADARNIQEYFAENKISSTITMEDLNELNLNYLDKEDVLKLFNKTIVQEPQPEGKYTSIPVFSMLQSKMVDDYIWQGAYYLCHGNIVEFRIELIYKCDIYLSDLVEADTATAEQKLIYNTYKEIEKNILDSNNFLVNKDIGSMVIGNVDFSLLEGVLHRIETGYRD
jgi:hypothetical protein